MEKIIGIITDFGFENPYVGSVKAKIYETAGNEIEIIDIFHHIEKHNIREAAYWINFLYKDYPEGTIFLCVIDPTVGTERKGILVSLENRFFIGPDNGIFTLLIKKKAKVYILPLPPETASSTFHARDYFSVWTAKIAVSPFIIRTLKVHKNPCILKLPKSYKKNNKIFGNAVIKDKFGNILTDIPNSWIENKRLILKIKNFKIIGPSKTYADKNKGELLFLKGSFGFVEIAANMESAFDVIKPEFPEEIEIEEEKNLK